MPRLSKVDLDVVINQFKLLLDNHLVANKHYEVLLSLKERFCVHTFEKALEEICGQLPEISTYPAVTFFYKTRVFLNEDLKTVRTDTTLEPTLASEKKIFTLKKLAEAVASIKEINNKSIITPGCHQDTLQPT